LAEIITIGDELLIGQVIDTNSAWIGQQLNEIGIKVYQITSISDNEQHILSALKDASQRADVILITGGLGPTKDDITKFTLCKYFKSNLRFDEKTFIQVEKLFQARGRQVTAVNRKQAEVPEKCEVIPNTQGTAPGMWFREKGKVFVSMPGVPYEMKGMMTEDVLPRLQKLFTEGVIIHKTIWFQGIGESFLSDMIEQWELALPANLKLAYLPSSGILRLRLTATGTSAEELNGLISVEVKKLNEIAGEYIFGEDNDTLEKLTAQLLTEQKATISTAESCTGGYIAHRITTVPGSSNYYLGSVVAYDNSIKENFLNISSNIIEKYGAVSEEVVIEMAKNVKEKFKTDYSIACSGIAGPSGGTEDKPVGTVHLAIAHPGGIFTKKLMLGTDRERIIRETALHSLNNLRKILKGEGS
ncbi:MAG: competence/damage-inducible protein A, partial [Bacteroidota bacterium]